MKQVVLPGELDLGDFRAVAVGEAAVALDPAARSNLARGRAFLEGRLAAGEEIYGVNTGFGPLVSRRVDEAATRELQENLVQQLSGSVGPRLPAAVGRGTLLLRAAAIARGHSGAREQTVSALVRMLQSGAAPVLRAYGSVGASGDLVPLAAMARALRGEGELYLPEGGIVSNSTARLGELGLEPTDLTAKEGLALVNGTSFSLSITALALVTAQRILEERAIPLAATLLLLFGDSLQHLSELIYRLKPHRSAGEVARWLREWALPESPGKAEESHGTPQPPYSARSLALWLGVVQEELTEAEKLATVEMNSVDDNPLVFAEEEVILHGANFQGTYVAKAADSVTAGVVKMGNLLERQINRLFHEKLNGDLPPFLAPEPVGLHSGLQGFQLLATSLLADMRTKAVVHGAQSFPTNGDNQDVVSMSANAALNALEVTRKCAYLVSVLECSVARALQLREPRLGEPLREWWEERRELLSFGYAAAPLDGILETRKAALMPWDFSK